ncbi:patatin-like protein 7 [Magnolia sinica]|uniref:patatin-like protein 7 n=1 Tax=Magnolia sinica TaxID=86752 RepID=UPI00265A2D1A|nr:patatin-like protein 7 [Magnolia sinica]
MAVAAAFAAPVEPSFDVDKLSYEIFSILESKFLFGYDTEPSLFLNGVANSPATGNLKTGKNTAGKVRILSIDAGGSTDGILAGKSLARLESSLRQGSGNPDARIADFFDVAAGSGAGGILAGLLFTKGSDGRPLFTAADALKFLAENRRTISSPSRNGIFRRVFRQSKSERIYRKALSDYTLKDTLKPVLIPCYDLSSGAPFLFSRADALETDGFDFKMREVCSATSAGRALEMLSVDGSTRIVAVGGGIAMSNPTAAAITHVLNNKHEFPFCRGVEDLLVVSLGNGESDYGMYGRRDLTPSAGEFVRIAGEGVADLVDQAVSMAFGHNRTSNYVRIQANGFNARKSQMTDGSSSGGDMRSLLADAEGMLAQKNVESVLFQGKKISGKTNAEMLDGFAVELIKEHERRKTSVFPTVVFKQVTPRSSSATTVSSC